MNDPTALGQLSLHSFSGAYHPQYHDSSFRRPRRARPGAKVLFPVFLFTAVFCLAKDATASRELNASPTSLGFGTVTVGSSSTNTVTLTNSGTQSLTISQATVTGAGFSIRGLSLPLTLAARRSTTFTATFAPTAAGSVTGKITVTSNATNSPATVSLSGTGVTLLLSASPASLSFGNATVGSSTNQIVTLTDTGTGSVTVSQATVTGAGFSVSGLSLPLTLAAGKNTTFTATFAPTAAGSVAGSISIVSNAKNSPATVSLSGTGVNSSSPSVALSWMPSSSQNVVGYNAYRGTVSGGPYTKLNSSLVATLFYTDTTVHSGQTYYYVTTAVDSNHNESAYSNQAQATLGIPQLTASPTSSNFGNIVLGSSSTLPVILRNTGTASVTISQATVTGTGFSISGLSLPLTLSAGQNTGLSTTFAPTAAGSVTGNVSIVSNATNSPTNESLSGTGIHAVNLSWIASTSAVAGYNVYRGSVSGGPYTKLTSSLVSGVLYTDTAVQAGVKYYYVTTAVTSSGTESAYSNQATAAVPSP